MKFLAELSVRARLVALVVFVNVLMLAGVGYAWYAISSLNAQLESALAMQARLAATGDLSRRAEVEFKMQVQEWKDLLLRGHEDGLYDKYLRAFRDRSATVAADLKAFAEQAQQVGIAPGPAQAALAEHEELDRRYDAALQAYRADDPGTTFAVDRAVRGMDRAPTERIGDLVKLAQDQAQRLTQEATRSAAGEKAKLVAGLAVLALLAAAVSIVAAWLTIAAILRRLARATEVARNVASGDLATHIDTGRDDELGKLLRSLRDMNDSLAGIVGRVRESAEKVSSAATQIAAGNTELASRTEEQASSLEETAASIEEMTATVTQNAANANQANELAASAAQVARRGGTAVEQVVKTMDGIQASSRKIADIIGLIDSIAFQTNILALNAAVEAARAGDHGRGFAVVAGEVRGLAQRSAEAAREIKALITDSVERVDAGAKIAGDAGQTMAEIVSGVSRVSQLIGEIAAASREQSSGITQASQAVGELDKTTQQNAALVQESTAASESLRRLALEMAEAVRVFRLAESTGAMPQAAAAAAPVPAVTGRPARRTRRIAPPAAGLGIPASPGLALASPGRTEEWREF